MAKLRFILSLFVCVLSMSTTSAHAQSDAGPLYSLELFLGGGAVSMDDANALLRESAALRGGALEIDPFERGVDLGLAFDVRLGPRATVGVGLVKTALFGGLSTADSVVTLRILTVQPSLRGSYELGRPWSWLRASVGGEVGMTWSVGEVDVDLPEAPRESFETSNRERTSRIAGDGRYGAAYLRASHPFARHGSAHVDLGYRMLSMEGAEFTGANPLLIDRPFDVEGSGPFLRMGIALLFGDAGTDAEPRTDPDTATETAAATAAATTDASSSWRAFTYALSFGMATYALGDVNDLLDQSNAALAAGGRSERWDPIEGGFAMAASIEGGRWRALHLGGGGSWLRARAALEVPGGEAAYTWEAVNFFATARWPWIHWGRAELSGISELGFNALAGQLSSPEPEFNGSLHGFGEHLAAGLRIDVSLNDHVGLIAEAGAQRSVARDVTFELEDIQDAHGEGFEADFSGTFARFGLRFRSDGGVSRSR